MKIRLSLRMMVVLGILVTGSVMIIAFSILSAKYFIDGLDISMRESMRNFAQLATPQDGEPVELSQFTVATRWEDLPSSIQTHLSPEFSENQKFVKKVIQPSYLSPPDAGYFAMQTDVDSEIRYVSIEFKRPVEVMPKPGVNYFQTIFYTCIGALAVFALVLIFLLRRTTGPMRDLLEWAQSLTHDKLYEPVPDFRFSDLNNMANIIHTSVSSVEQSVQRERQFLAHASHELRTPITVTKSNIALLRKLLEKAQPLNKQLDVCGRIERSANTMTQLTETILWLNREEGRHLELSSVKLSNLVSQICEELHYLIEHKAINVELSLDVHPVALPEALGRIVFTNLIRNAFQHTQEGTINIEQHGSTITIINQNRDNVSSRDDLGFGLGLALTERLVERYGWAYDVEESVNGRKVTLVLPYDNQVDAENAAY